MENNVQKNKKAVIVISIAALIAVVTVSIIIGVLKNDKNDEAVYRETSSEYGKLTVGITETSEVNIGTLTQSFDLDISALVNNESQSGTQQGEMTGGGMGMQMMFSMGENTYTSQTQEMEIQKVHIAVGQKINEGEVLYTLSEESVNKIRNQLKEDVEDTLSEYEALQVEQQQSRNEAKQGYDTYVTGGKLAQITYDKTISELEDNVNETQEMLLDKQNKYNENLQEIIELNTELTKAKKDLNEAQGAVSENYDNRYKEPYYYTVYENTREMAQTIVDNLENELEELTEENVTLMSEIEEATRSWNEACRNLETEKLSAQQTLETDKYYSQSASEWYDIQISSLDNEKENAYNSYISALNKLDKFDSYISGNDVIAEYSGVITQVPLEAGDSITQNTSLVTLYDAEEVTMEIKVSEADYNAIDKNGNVNISYTAYPDTIYNGIISEISDAEYDSSSAETYYTITITVQGDTSGLYEGMTGDVTCVTKETKEVLYISNRAVFREGARSYVKLYDTEGNVIEKDIKTGFSDGINVEITEGLSEGDIVLIESKVSDK